MSEVNMSEVNVTVDTGAVMDALRNAARERLRSGAAGGALYISDKDVSVIIGDHVEAIMREVLADDGFRTQIAETLRKMYRETLVDTVCYEVEAWARTGARRILKAQTEEAIRAALGQHGLLGPPAKKAAKKPAKRAR